MKIWLHAYHLPRLGALLRVEWDANRIGFSDLHPWPEFGEPHLEQHITSLSTLEFTELVEHSLDFNFADAEYRRQNRSAFLGLELPRAHRLIFDLRNMEAEDLAGWEAEGLTHVKVKLGQRLRQETPIFERLVAKSKLKWRLDFNALLSADEFEDWWRALKPITKRAIDFVEDPAFDEIEIAGPWADDWVEQPGARVRIIKPARDTAEDVLPGQRVVFTHSLDHPLGQAAAVWSAARYYQRYPHKREVCGLGTGSHILKPVPGTGFGFDEMLLNLPWERLK